MSSPPWLNDHDAEKRGEKLLVDASSRCRHKTRLVEGSAKEYGTADGQLAAMPPGDVADAIVSSPPYEHCLDDRGRDPIKTEARKERFNKAHPGMAAHIQKPIVNYGGTDGNIGEEHGETFWSAAREIVLQCHQILRPGGVAIWVCKDFIRKGQRVPFSADWQRLCIACGFEPVEWIKASLVKEQRHAGLFGEDIVTRTERKGFFRRLAEKKGSPPIDEEDLIIVRKP